jgi:hypothetical protein
MWYSPEFLSWREAEYRVADAEVQLRARMKVVGPPEHYLDAVRKVCALRAAAAQDLAVLLLSNEARAHASRWGNAVKRVQIPRNKW